MIKPYKLGQIILSTLIMISLGWGTGGSFAFAQTAEICKARYSYHWFPAHHLAVYSEKFAQLCKAETKGRLEVTTFPSGQLYSLRESIGAVSQANVDLAGVVALVLASVAPEFGVDTMMMLFQDYDQQRKVWMTEPGKAIMSKIEGKLGIKILCRIPNGPACLFTSGKKVQKLDDFKGLKSRFVSASERPFLDALGANTLSVTTEQLYTGLQSGQINSLFTVPTGIKAYSLWDFTKFATLPYLCFPDSFIVANAKWWNGLPQDIRDTVMKGVVPKVEKESLDYVMDDAKTVLDEFVKQKGGAISTLSDSDIKALKEICGTKVWPPLATKYDPTFWDAVAKQQGIGK
ncbi:MAG: hypothetical protein A2169_11885 [Deltaproteobacteria bacterium RBG_13_47_9]|nr:MAG: hypothetical protein A2169_11885 [Deltaproteobacteria bacterium RBG_13_47_9]